MDEDLNGKIHAHCYLYICKKNSEKTNKKEKMEKKIHRESRNKTLKSFFLVSGAFFVI